MNQFSQLLEFQNCEVSFTTISFLLFLPSLSLLIYRIFYCGLKMMVIYSKIYLYLPCLRVEIYIYKVITKLKHEYYVLTCFLSLYRRQKRANKHNWTWRYFIYTEGSIFYPYFGHILSTFWSYDVIIDCKFFRGSDNNS